MAEIRLTIDDLDLDEGKSEEEAAIATETRYVLGADGVTVKRLQLSADNAEAYDQAQARFWGAARDYGYATVTEGRPRGRSRSGSRPARSGSGDLLGPEQSKAAREWARGLGLTVGSEGRIAKPIALGYLLAQNDPSQAADILKRWDAEGRKGVPDELREVERTRAGDGN